ncbi:MAG TPA: hypothetical protein ENI23_12815 [bacterium]|nr:hypothetical protein [bacterium]
MKKDDESWDLLDPQIGAAFEETFHNTHATMNKFLSIIVRKPIAPPKIVINPDSEYAFQYNFLARTLEVNVDRLNEVGTKGNNLAARMLTLSLVCVDHYIFYRAIEEDNSVTVRVGVKEIDYGDSQQKEVRNEALNDAIKVALIIINGEELLSKELLNTVKLPKENDKSEEYRHIFVIASMLIAIKKVIADTDDDKILIFEHIFHKILSEVLFSEDLDLFKQYMGLCTLLLNSGGALAINHDILYLFEREDIEALTAIDRELVGFYDSQET